MISKSWQYNPIQPEGHQDRIRNHATMNEHESQAPPFADWLLMKSALVFGNIETEPAAIRIVLVRNDIIHRCVAFPCASTDPRWGDGTDDAPRSPHHKRCTSAPMNLPLFDCKC
jgi:hypothetical protein